MQAQEDMPNPVEIFLAQYKAVAGEGATLELKMRMLADKVPALASYAHASRLEDVEEQLISFFSAHLQPQECETLRLCRQLRNKLLHCDFRTARTKLSQLGAPETHGRVQRIKLDHLSDEPLFKQIADAVSGAQAPDYIADTESTADGGVFGWLIELGSGGDFRHAFEIFRTTIAIVERLAVVADELEAETR